MRIQGAGDNLPINDAFLRSCEQDLARLGQGLPPKRNLAATQGDLAHLLARLVLGPQACLAAKVEVTKSLLTGQAEPAEALLARHQQSARAWAAAWPEPTQ